jgi:hypothetical protein
VDGGGAPGHPIFAKALVIAPPKSPFIKRKNLVGMITVIGYFT